MVGDRLGDVQSVGATPLFFSIAWTVRPQGFAWPEGLIAVLDSVVGHGARTVRLRVLQRTGRSAGGAASGSFAQPDGMDATLGSVAEPGLARPAFTQVSACASLKVPLDQRITIRCAVALFGGVDTTRQWSTI